MGGQEVDTQGDAFFVSFPRAGDALAALAMSHPQCDPIPREGAKKHLNELEDKLPQILSKKYIAF